MIDKNTIEKRIAILDEDIVKVKQNLQNLEQQKIETIGMINALTGAKQQCQSNIPHNLGVFKKEKPNGW